MRVPYEGRPGRRRQEVRTYATTTRPLLELRDWPIRQGVSRRDGGHLGVLEATVLPLEDAIECLAVNAGSLRRAGQAETDRLDAVWLCKLAERGMLRPSFVPRGSGSCGICAGTGAP